MKSRIYKKVAGFSLIELLVSITIMAVLAAMAAPSMQSYIARQQMRTHAQELVDAMMLARSEALANGISYRLEPKSDDWNNGWETYEIGTDGTELFKNYEVTNPVLPLSMEEGDTTSNTVTFDGNGRANTLTRFELDYSRASAGFKPYCITVAGSGNIDVVIDECDNL